MSVSQNSNVCAIDQSWLAIIKLWDFWTKTLYRKMFPNKSRFEFRKKFPKDSSYDKLILYLIIYIIFFIKISISLYSRKQAVLSDIFL